MQRRFPPNRLLALALAVAVGLPALAANVLAAPASDIRPDPGNPTTSSENSMAQHSYAGMWITDDGHVRHELLPNGRYDEARGTRESAYRGRYEVQGDHIEYWDDTGFTADGDFVDADTLHHGGMVLRRRRDAQGVSRSGRMPAAR